MQTLSEVFTIEVIVGRIDRRQSLTTRTRILSFGFPGALLEGMDIIIIKCKRTPSFITVINLKKEREGAYTGYKTDHCVAHNPRKSLTLNLLKHICGHPYPE